MSHSYEPTCDCKRCIRERNRRTAQTVQSRLHGPEKKLYDAIFLDGRNQRRKRVRERQASREEQHAHYLDSGHNDDIGESPDY